MKYYLIIIFVFVSCSTVDQYKYSDERYRVYDAILEKEFPWYQFQKVLVSNETTQGLPNPARPQDSELVHLNDLRQLKGHWQDFDPDNFYADYLDRNSTPSPLDANLLHPIRHVESINLKTSNYADYFRKDFIDNAIVYCYSMPSFNKDFTEAIVYYQYYCGNARGEGAWCWLKKKEGIWEIVGRHQLWWS
jgi:hypothetical protein